MIISIGLGFLFFWGGLLDYKHHFRREGVRVGIVIPV